MPHLLSCLLGPPSVFPPKQWGRCGYRGLHSWGPILQMGYSQLREVRLLAQGHKASKRAGQKSILTPEASSGGGCGGREGCWPFKSLVLVLPQGYRLQPWKHD